MEVEVALANALEQFSVNVHAYGYFDENYEVDKPRWRDVKIVPSKCIGPRSFGFAPKMFQDAVRSGLNVIHLHGVWMYPSIVANRIHRTRNSPLMITPHGMLEPWTLKHSRLKKRIALFLFQRQTFQRSFCIHAITKNEVADIRAAGVDKPIVLIPNGIELPHSELFSNRKHFESSPTKVLFLGRLHKKKGLPQFLHAWRQSLEDKLIPESAVFVIAGWDQQNHKSSLEDYCQQLGLRFRNSDCDEFLRSPDAVARNTDVLFVGPVFGKNKTDLLNLSDLFVLPSHSEGLPMSVLEAWAHEKPVLMTKQCNLEVGLDYDAAILADPSSDSLIVGLKEFFKMSKERQRQMGANGRSLVAERFSWNQIAKEMAQVYKWGLGMADRPESLVCIP